MKFKKSIITISTAALALGAVVGTAGSSSAATKQKTLGIVALVASDSLNQAVIKGATEVAKTAGWKVFVTDTQGSPEKANAAMITYSTTQKTDAIMPMAFHSSALSAGLAAAKKAGNIPVASWGGEIAPGIVVTTSALKVGQDSVNALLKDFGTKGSLLELTYHTGVLCYFRQIAIDTKMKTVPGIKVTQNEVAIPGQVQSGSDFTAAWLASHPAGKEPLAIWGTWDEPATGAIAALKQANRTDVKVYGINGGPTALQQIKDGTLQQVVWQDGYTEGKALMQGILDAQKAGKSWKPKVVNVPGVVVTKQTIDAFLTAHPDATK